jgi:hypothetical protein
MQILVPAAQTASRNVGPLATKSGRDDKDSNHTAGPKDWSPEGII